MKKPIIGKIVSNLKLGKNNFILFICLITGLSNAFTQELKHDALIKDFLGLDRYTEVTESNPSYLKFLNARYSNGFKIMDFVEEKMKDFQIVEAIYYSEWKTSEINGKECKQFIQTKITPEEFVIASESPDFNFLKYQFNYDRTNVVYYILGNTGKVIMIVSTEQISKIVNQEN